MITYRKYVFQKVQLCQKSKIQYDKSYCSIGSDVFIGFPKKNFFRLTNTFHLPKKEPHIWKQHIKTGTFLWDTESGTFFETPDNLTHFPPVPPFPLTYPQLSPDQATVLVTTIAYYISAGVFVFIMGAAILFLVLYKCGFICGGGGGGSDDGGGGGGGREGQRQRGFPTISARTSSVMQVRRQCHCVNVSKVIDICRVMSENCVILE